MRHERERERESCAELKTTLNSVKNKDLRQDSSNSHDSLQNYKKLNYDSLSDDEKQEKYIFHILSDFVSQDSRAKLANLAKDLSQIYPCEIEIHICDDTLFVNFPKWCGNYVAYYRFFIPDFMPKDLKVCLYLDVDMLALQDLRGLFALDLGDKVAGVVLDQLQFCFIHQSEYYYADEFSFHDFYFNSGLLLINLEAWQKQKIFQKATTFLRSYNVVSHDQDALNVAIRKENALILPLEFNIFALFFPQTNQSAYSLLNGFRIDYTQDEARLALANPAIIHFACQDLKPWNLKQYNHILQDGQNIAMLWWKMAFETPFIDLLKDRFLEKWQEMLVIYDKYKDEHHAKMAFVDYLVHLIWENSQSFCGYVKMPFIARSAFRRFSVYKNYALDSHKSCESLDRDLALKLLNEATRVLESAGINRIRKFMLLPFRIWCAKNRYKKSC